ncbi:MAG: L,D-transpeptidase [Desulfuromonadales bacterium]|nr:L,D-transpeptidase [Desulfuromonadales bacterium]
MKALISIPLFLLTLFLLPPRPAQGWYPKLASESLLTDSLSVQTVGKNRSYILAPGEILPEIARRCRIGYNPLVAANPGVDPWRPGDWREVLLPYRTILPTGAGPGITINLAEYRLYLIWNEDGGKRVRIYPIGIGQKGWNSPEGRFEITVKIESPSWTPPQALRQKEQDLFTIPPGSGNPLGKYWLGLSAPGFGIHGTDKPFGVGRRVSHGCIRLYSADIEDLNRLARIGMPVSIVYQPIKLALDGDTLLAQIHPDFLGRIETPLDEALRIKNGLGWRGEIDWKALERTIKEARGIPVPISKPR